MYATAKGISRFLEAHSPLSAIIAEQVYYKNKQGKIAIGYFGESTGPVIKEK